LLPREQVCDKSRLSVNLWGGQCGLGVNKQASFVCCLAVRHSAVESCRVYRIAAKKIYIQAQQVTTQETDALAILGYAANVLRVKNCPSKAGEN